MSPHGLGGKLKIMNAYILINKAFSLHTLQIFLHFRKVNKLVSLYRKYISMQFALLSFFASKEESSLPSRTNDVVRCEGRLLTSCTGENTSLPSFLVHSFDEVGLQYNWWPATQLSFATKNASVICNVISTISKWVTAKYAHVGSAGRYNKELAKTFGMLSSGDFSTWWRMTFKLHINKLHKLPRPMNYSLYLKPT